MDMLKQSSVRRQWRKLVKKQQRKRKRQAQARQRDKKLELEYLEKMNDPSQMELLQKQRNLEDIQEKIEYQKQCDEEEAWLRRELLAQKEFKRAQRAALSNQTNNTANCCIYQQKEKQNRNDQPQQHNDSCSKEFDVLMQLMDAYISNVNMRTPPQFSTYVESHPDIRECEFFYKTNCCRFGFTCCFNHKRPILSKCIIIKNFFQHPSLNIELREHKEYSSGDDYLELDDDDLRKSYEEFCEDVWPELEKFGNIVIFKVTKNVQKHLRGHAFVEYKYKRESLKAFINLHGRFYATKRLNVEFSNIKNWRTAVCGMSLNHNCPKGILCNYLHFFENPKHKYEKSLEYTSSTNLTKQTLSTPLLSWSMIENIKGKSGKGTNWRWSESPEIDIQEGKVPLKPTKAVKSHHSKEIKTCTSKHKDKVIKRKDLKYKNSSRKHSKRKPKRKYDNAKKEK